jgi:hypothetical protein
MVRPWVVAWQGLKLPVDGHALISDRPGVDKGVFGLWAIRRASPESGKTVSRANLARFLWEAFEIKVDDKGLERAFAKGADGRVARVSGATFQILPPGIVWAEGVAGLKSEEKAAPVSKATPKKAGVPKP